MAGKIVFFLPSLRGGGAERVMLDLAIAITRRGFPVDLVLAKAEGPYLAQVPTEITVVNLGASRVLRSFVPLVGFIRRTRPAAVLSTLNYANVLAVGAVRLAGSKSRIIVREATTASNGKLPVRFLGHLAFWLMRKSYRWADQVVAVSQGVADDLANCGIVERNHIQVIYNPVISTKLFSLAEEPVDHPWLNLTEEPVVLAVGRLVKAKDYPTLIKAFAGVRAHRSARLIILGEGEERRRLEAFVADMGLAGVVHLPGFVENPFAYMARARVFALSSEREGLPNALIQALALGTPVVSTDCRSGPREILRGGRLGELVPVGDYQRLQQGILRAMDAPKRENGQELLDFSAEKITDIYLSTLLGGHIA